MAGNFFFLFFSFYKQIKSEVGLLLFVDEFLLMCCTSPADAAKPKVVRQLILKKNNLRIPFYFKTQSSVEFSFSEIWLIWQACLFNKYALLFRVLGSILSSGYSLCGVFHVFPVYVCFIEVCRLPPISQKHEGLVSTIIQDLQYIRPFNHFQSDFH